MIMIKSTTSVKHIAAYSTILQHQIVYLTKTT